MACGVCGVWSSVVWAVGVAVALVWHVMCKALASLFRKKRAVNTQRIAVIGGGIAGSGAAWALARAGHSVVLYESRATIGGNAKVHQWESDSEASNDQKPSKLPEKKDRDEDVTGLSVLAWPDRYFHNYAALLKELGVRDVEVTLPFALRDPDVCDFFHGSPIDETFRRDMQRWYSLVNTVRYVNTRLTGTDSSLYSFSLLNPFNIIPLYLAARIWGVSSRFWDTIVVPIYSSSFLTQNIRTIPAIILPAIDDMIPLNGVPKMRTWEGNSAEVFRRMCANVTVKAGSAVLEVRAVKESNGVTKHLVRDASNDFDYFDIVVFACSSDNALRSLRNPTYLQRQILSSVTYCDDHDVTFNRGIIHRDASVLPEDLRDDLLSKFSNYIRIYRNPQNKNTKKLPAPYAYENTFILSSWVPAVQGTVNAPMLVTYNSQHEHIEHVQGTVSNLRAHPDLSVTNLLLAQMIGAIQGDNGVYYCGSYTTPGNGHDLSLLSGLIVAHAIGAPYPFPNDHVAAADFRRLRRLMHL